MVSLVYDAVYVFIYQCLFVVCAAVPADVDAPCTEEDAKLTEFERDQSSLGGHFLLGHLHAWSQPGR